MQSQNISLFGVDGNGLGHNPWRQWRWQDKPDESIRKIAF